MSDSCFEEVVRKETVPKSTVLRVANLGWTETLPDRIQIKDLSSGTVTVFPYQIIDNVGTAVGDIVIELLARLDIEVVSRCFEQNKRGMAVAEMLVINDRRDLSIHEIKEAF